MSKIVVVVAAVKPELKVKPTNTTVNEGEAVMLSCAATGDPTPTIQWDRNPEPDSFDLHRFQVCKDMKVPMNGWMDNNNNKRFILRRKIPK